MENPKSDVLHSNIERAHALTGKTTGNCCLLDAMQCYASSDIIIIMMATWIFVSKYVESHVELIFRGAEALPSSSV